MIQQTCSIEGCDKSVKTKRLGVCNMHYMRFKRFGTYDLTAKALPPKKCIVDGCSNNSIPKKTAGLCMKHWRRKRRYGTTKLLERVRHPCVVDGCPHKCSHINERGPCAGHRRSMEIYGTYDKYKPHTPMDQLQRKLSQYLRTRINAAVKKGSRRGSAVRDLGCSIPEFKKYLEVQFEDGMTWDNWRHDGWHIDHIIPLNTFDLTCREQFLQATHYTNMRPLWARENFARPKNGEDLLPQILKNRLW